jgi:APA family basic amino acid/polyamine antiporter
MLSGVTATATPLSRRLGLGDAIVIGLGSMIGAGVFSSFAPAAGAAGAGLLIGLGLAAIVAFCNALASAQLAAAYPVSGGTYAYGRAQLGPWWGFVAGWSFVIGKTASGAAMAATFAAYVAPAAAQRPLAALAIAAVAAVNFFGITRTALVTRILVIVVLLVLVFCVVVGWTSGTPSNGLAAGSLFAGGWYGILQSAGLLFFAFAGYARIATMGEEVRNPARTIPAAITIALSVTVVVYAVIALTLLRVLGPTATARSADPLAELVRAAGLGGAVPVVVIGAAAASLGALLGLIAGVSRTALAMARAHDLPHPLAAVHPRWQVPHRAELLIAAIAIVLVLTVDLRTAIGFSSFGVLLYYAIANLSALTQHRAQRRYPRALQILGLLGCVVLAVTLPPVDVIAGGAVVAIGIVGRLIALWRRSSA